MPQFSANVIRFLFVYFFLSSAAFGNPTDFAERTIKAASPAEKIAIFVEFAGSEDKLDTQTRWDSYLDGLRKTPGAFAELAQAIRANPTFEARSHFMFAVLQLSELTRHSLEADVKKEMVATIYSELRSGDPFLQGFASNCMINLSSWVRDGATIGGFDKAYAAAVDIAVQSLTDPAPNTGPGRIGRFGMVMRAGRFDAKMVPLLGQELLRWHSSSQLEKLEFIEGLEDLEVATQKAYAEARAGRPYDPGMVTGYTMTLILVGQLFPKLLVHEKHEGVKTFMEKWARIGADMCEVVKLESVRRSSSN